MVSPEAIQALSKAKIGLMAKPQSVFWSAVCLSLKHTFNDRIPTARTNGILIEYNPDFFMNCNKEQRIGLLVHETMHVAMLSFARLGARKMPEWNAATDFANNLVIANAGFKLPEGALLSRQYEAMSAEEIYEDLITSGDMPQNPMEDLQVFGDGEGTAPATAEELRQIQAQVDDILVRAVMQSQMRGDNAGSIPGDIARYVKDLLNPIVPWYRILRSFMTKSARTDYNFHKPNRRFFPDAILPSFSGTRLCDLAIAVDTSRSVTDVEFEHFIGETAHIIKALRPDTTTLIHFDTVIKEVDKLHSLQDARRVEFTGYGGTEIDPPLQWARDNKPAVLIIFTDGHYRPPTTKPRCQVIWIIVGNPKYKAPFGKTIHYRISE
jgi:predicted metal-dependent peptidase